MSDKKLKKKKEKAREEFNSSELIRHHRYQKNHRVDQLECQHYFQSKVQLHHKEQEPYLLQTTKTSHSSEIF